MIERNSVSILHGDCLAEMQRLLDEGVRVDAIVTDPPYHLTTGKKGGTGEASLNPNSPAGRARISTGFMGKVWDGGDVAFRVETWELAMQLLKPGGHLIAFSGTRTYHRMACAVEDAGFEIRDQLGWMFGTGFPKSRNVSKAIDIEAGLDPDEGEPITEAARIWIGWGTALKPGWEPICLARKPIEPGLTVAGNVLKHGTGALNIDGCRVGTDDNTARPNGVNALGVMNDDAWQPKPGIGGGDEQGRWPANVIHDGSDEVIAAFAAYGDEKGAAAPVTKRNADKLRNAYGAFKGNIDEAGSTFQGDTGTAARFFYSAKADADDRCESKHPTVKPVALMRWLVRLVTPSGGTVLDPFAGTGTTGLAALREGMAAILIEREDEYVGDIRRRIDRLHGTDTPLFGGGA